MDCYMTKWKTTVYHFTASVMINIVNCWNCLSALGASLLAYIYVAVRFKIHKIRGDRCEFSTTLILNSIQQSQCISLLLTQFLPTIYYHFVRTNSQVDSNVIKKRPRRNSIAKFRKNATKIVVALRVAYGDVMAVMAESC